MRGVAQLFSIIACILLIIAILIGCVWLVVFNLDFFDQEYRKQDTARSLKATHSDLMTVTEGLLDYIKGDRDELKSIKIAINGETQRVFNEQEREHMVDVRMLYQSALTIQRLALLIALGLQLLSLIIMRREWPLTLTRGYTIAAILLGFVIGVLVIWMAIDFDSFWNAFHSLSFSNMLWQMDTRTSFMINMFPLSFWLTVCSTVLRYFAIIAGAMLLVSTGYWIYRVKRRISIAKIKE